MVLVSSGIEFPENISANFFLSIFEKSKFNVDASSSFNITYSVSWTGVGLIFSL